MGDGHTYQGTVNAGSSWGNTAPCTLLAEVIPPGAPVNGDASRLKAQVALLASVGPHKHIAPCLRVAVERVVGVLAQAVAVDHPEWDGADRFAVVAEFHGFEQSLQDVLTEMRAYTSTPAPFPLNFFVPIARQLFEVATLLAARGILHRDLAPGNVFVHATGADVTLASFHSALALVGGHKNVVRKCARCPPCLLRPLRPLRLLPLSCYHIFPHNVMCVLACVSVSLCVHASVCLCVCTVLPHSPRGVKRPACQ